MIWRGLSYICGVLLTLTRSRNACRAQSTLRAKPVAYLNRDAVELEYPRTSIALLLQ